MVVEKETTLNCHPISEILDSIHPFSRSESVKKVIAWEITTLEGKVRCGLEILRAKICLPHGAFIPYLHECHLSRSTGDRRMNIAEEFIRFLGYQGNIDEECILDAMTKCVNLKHFKDNRDSQGDNSLQLDLIAKNEVKVSHPEEILETGLKQVEAMIERVESTYIKHYPEWSPIQIQELGNKLETTAGRLLYLKKRLDELDSLSIKNKMVVLEIDGKAKKYPFVFGYNDPRKEHESLKRMLERLNKEPKTLGTVKLIAAIEEKLKTVIKEEEESYGYIDNQSTTSERPVGLNS